MLLAFLRVAEDERPWRREPSHGSASLVLSFRAERNLLRRADQYPFLLKNVPAISFIFGYDPATESERRYREWYQIRYHRPQDDLTQPIDFAAAAKFNDFFYKLVAAIAADPHRPEILPTSQFARKN